MYDVGIYTKILRPGLQNALWICFRALRVHHYQHSPWDWVSPLHVGLTIRRQLFVLRL
jgi:hypothetical protein